MSKTGTAEVSFPSFLDVTRISWKQMVLIPIIFLLFNCGILAWNRSKTGSFVNLGIDFAGGSLISFPNSYELSPEEIESELRQRFGISEISVRKGGGVLTVETPGKVEEILAYMGRNYNKEGTSTILDVPLAETFRSQAPWVLIAAFVGMGLVVYIVFRTPLPSVYIALCGFLDILEATALITLAGVRISLATVAALLMLIGYSVDTDILLTTRLLKRRDSLRDRMLGAMKTGMTMSLTTLTAVTALHILTTSSVLKEISLVLIFGMLADMLNTWLMNAGLLRGYLSRRFALLEQRGRRK